MNRLIIVQEIWDILAEADLDETNIKEEIRDLLQEEVDLDELYIEQQIRAILEGIDGVNIRQEIRGLLLDKIDLDRFPKLDQGIEFFLLFLYINEVITEEQGISIQSIQDVEDQLIELVEIILNTTGAYDQYLILLEFPEARNIAVNYLLRQLAGVMGRLVTRRMIGKCVYTIIDVN